MSVRIRESGEMVCAAMFPAEPGDVYLDDNVHYRLAAELKVLVAEPYEQHQHDGRWFWRDDVPSDRVIDPWFLNRAPRPEHTIDGR